jgi:hypothetical protein
VVQRYWIQAAAAMREGVEKEDGERGDGGRWRRTRGGREKKRDSD